MRTVIVTGAARGIGRHCVDALLERGHRVAGVDRAFPEGDLPHGDRFLRIDGDLADPAFVNRVPQVVADLWGPADGLVNNAAVSLSQDPLELTPESWDHTLAVNLTAPALLSLAFARLIVGRGGGVIVNIASVNSFAAERHATAYVAAKSGLLGLTRSLAVDLAEHSITVNAVAPGAITTERWTERNSTRGFERAMSRGVPLRRAGRSDEVADVVTFLLERAPQYMTGSTITLDGGLTALIPREQEDD